MLPFAAIGALCVAATPPGQPAMSALDVNARGQLVSWSRIIVHESLRQRGRWADATWRQRLADGTMPRRVPLKHHSVMAMGYIGDRVAGDVDIVGEALMQRDPGERDEAATNFVFGGEHAASVACVSGAWPCIQRGARALLDTMMPREIIAGALPGEDPVLLRRGLDVSAAAWFLAFAPTSEDELAPLSTESTLAWTIAR